LGRNEIKSETAGSTLSRVPIKKTMNFVQNDRNLSLKKVALFFMILLVLSALFLKLAVLEPLARKNAAETELLARQAQLESLNRTLESYEQIKAEYGRYSDGWLTESDIRLVDRLDILNLVEEEIAPGASIENLAVNHNVLTLNIAGISLEEAGTLVQQLENHPIVESASVYNVVSANGQEANIFMSILLTKGDT